jgi:hypothetical protein
MSKVYDANKNIVTDKNANYGTLKEPILTASTESNELVFNHLYFNISSDSLNCVYSKKETKAPQNVVSFFKLV